MTADLPQLEGAASTRVAAQRLPHAHGSTVYYCSEQLCQHERIGLAFQLLVRDSACAAPPLLQAASLAADSAAQQQEQQRLRAVLDAYEQLRLVRSQELALNTTAAEEEVALVFDFLEKMACQMSEAESELTALLQELHAQTHAAQDMLATEQQRP